VNWEYFLITNTASGAIYKMLQVGVLKEKKIIVKEISYIILLAGREGRICVYFVIIKNAK